MSKIIFVRHSEGRLPQYSIQTIGYNEAGLKKFAKRPRPGSSSDGHLREMIRTFLQFDKKGLSQYFCRPKLASDGSVQFPGIEGESTQGKIMRALGVGSEAAVITALEDYIDLLTRISTDEYTNSKEANWLVLEIERSFPGHRKISPAIIDVNLDNVIWAGDKAVIIDYEWVFEGGVSPWYVFARSVLWLSLRFSRKFAEYAGKMSMSEIGPELLVPTCVLEKFPNLPKLLKECLQIEYDYFQPLVAGVKTTRPTLFKQPKPWKKTRSFYIDDLEASLKKTELAMFGYEQERKQLNRARLQYKKALEDLVSSRSYFIGRMLTRPYRFLIFKMRGKKFID